VTFDREKLQRLARRSHEIAQHGHVGSVRANASRIHGQTKSLGLIEVDTRVIQLRKAEALRGQNAVQSRRINRAGRTMSLPWPSRQFIELLPIAFVPSCHSLLAARPVRLQQTVPSQTLHLTITFRDAALDALLRPMVASSYLTSTGKTLYPVCAVRHLKSPTRPAKHTRLTYIHEAFPTLLYQTRYGVICFATFQQSFCRPFPADSPTKLPRQDGRYRRRRHATRRLDTFDAKSGKSSPGRGGRSPRQRRRKFRQPLR
jgi:hypothetical protein